MDIAHILRTFALSLPEASEEAHWGKPSFRVRGKIFAVLQEEGVTLTIKTTPEERDMYAAAQSDVYRVPESYATLNYMHINMVAADPEEMQELLLKAWSLVAPKKLVKAYVEKKAGEI